MDSDFWIWNPRQGNLWFKSSSTLDCTDNHKGSWGAVSVEKILIDFDICYGTARYFARLKATITLT
jgi:hypothetical protein